MIDDVRGAQAGDHAAYARLVRRFEPLAVRFAAAWLKDATLAEDAAQDAFIDAFLRLPQLREPAAFPGWFRRIVHKHCDRRTRLAAPAVLDVLARAPKDEAPDLLDDVERLPPHQRIVVALHYLGDEPQQDVAEFLELPLSTVKKRLHDARKRLRNQKRRPPMKNTRDLADRITLFLAIRSGDTERTEAILTKHPELLDAQEQWSAEEALAGGFPLAHKLTPLILAAGRGDEKTVTLLLRLGAEPNGTCGCDGGETALLAAATNGHAPIVETLLEAGANRAAKNAVGYTAADIAKIRDHADVCRVFGVAAPHTKTSETWTGPTIETGIKAIDLLCPLEAHSIVRVHGAAETGLTVLLAELTHRLGTLGGHSVWTAGARGQWYGAELEHLAGELGVARYTTIATTGALDAVERAKNDLVALFIFVKDGNEAEVEAALPAFARDATITFVIDPWVPVTAGTRDPPRLAAPYGAVICTSPALAGRNIYPAIDPEHSRSNTDVSPAHEAARAYARETYRTAPERIVDKFAQYFEVYAHQTGRAGEVIPLAETIRLFTPE